jgi:hypothetical protein
MNRQKINRISWTVPVVMSLLAFLLVIAALATGNAKSGGDEGAAAHIFQLLIVLQAPFLLAFVVTADWRHWQGSAGRMVLLLGALVIAFAPVALFKL